MQEQFAIYDIALKLKKLNFDEPCFAYFRNKDTLVLLGHGMSGLKYSWIEDKNVILAPLWQQITDWFLKEKHLYIDITFKEVNGPKVQGINSVYFDIEIYSIFGGDTWKKYRFSEISDNYHYARKQAILKALELCQKKNRLNDDDSLVDKLAEFRKNDPNQLDLFHYLDDPSISEDKLPKLNKEKNETKS